MPQPRVRALRVRPEGAGRVVDPGRVSWVWMEGVSAERTVGERSGVGA